MAMRVQVGTILIENRPLILRALDLESESYSGNWGVLQSHTSTTLAQKIRDRGWSCFFPADEVNATVFGTLAPKSIRRALKKIFAKVRVPDSNCLEVTSISQNRFLGLPYITVCAHSRQIRQGSLMNLLHKLQP
jgi:hypothetical protein